MERDPKSYKEAMRGPNARQWRTECEGEIDQQRKMGTYKLVPRPNKPVNVVDNKWVFHSKYNAQGELLKRKARLVAKASRNGQVSTTSRLTHPSYATPPCAVC